MLDLRFTPPLLHSCSNGLGHHIVVKEGATVEETEPLRLEPEQEIPEHRKHRAQVALDTEDAGCSTEEGEEPPKHEDIQRAAARLEGPAQSSESDTEADSDAEPRGAGLSGSGPAMTVGRLEKAREICDGAGRCSPGRWPPLTRPRPSSNLVRDVGTAIRRCIQRLDQDGHTLDDLFDKLASG